MNPINSSQFSRETGAVPLPTPAIEGKEAVCSLASEALTASGEAIKAQAARSLSEIAANEDQADIVKKSSAYWQCIDRQPDKSGGFIYQFQVREEYNPYSPDIPYEQMAGFRKRILAKEKSIFPAAELLATEVGELLPSSDDDLANRSIAMNVLEALGFSCDVDWDETAFISLPDREALLGRWQELQKNRPDLELPDLDIYLSQDIASDREFIEAFCKHDAILSDGAEFVHDMLRHIRPIILCLCNRRENGKSDYTEVKSKLATNIEKIEQAILDGLARIEENKDISEEEKDQARLKFRIFEKMIGAFTDSASTIIYQEEIRELKWDSTHDWIQKSIIEHSEWEAYFIKHFGEDNVKNHPFKALWKEIVEAPTEIA